MNLGEMFATPALIGAQCVGFVAMVISFFVYAFRDRRKILFSKLLTDLLWVAHYVLLGAYSGAVTNGINAVREGVFYHKDKIRARRLFFPVLFVCLNVATLAFSWQGWVSILPAVGASLNVAALWSTNTKRLRVLVIPAMTAWLTYSVLVHSLWGTVVGVASIVSAAVGLVRERTKRNHA